jgi:hypothetical protein
MYALTLIEAFYGERTAERSGLPLINHIHEGLEILDGLGATENAKAAFCLHPMLQNDLDYHNNCTRLSADDRVGITEFALAVDYRRHANAYLCRPSTDHWTQEDIAANVGVLGMEVRHMLIADKQQNQKDFMAHHYGTHERSGQLIRYFHNWLDYLGVSELKA